MSRTASVGASVVLTLGLAAALGLSAAAQPTVGTGFSLLAEARAAGAEAAGLAARPFGAATPAVVVVFAARSLLSQDLIDGVASVFDRRLLYGCEGYAPLTSAGNAADQGHTAANAVAVLALGGAASIYCAAERTDGEGDYGGCGRRLGTILKPRLRPDQGSLLLTFGDQHVGRENRDLVGGLQEVLGAKARIAGAAAGGPEAKEIVGGQIVTRTNVAILLCGDFHVRVATRGGDGDLLDNAREAFLQAFGTDASAGLLGFVFDCGGRRGQLFGQKQLAAEHRAMLALAGGVPLFGFYGGGEIGAADDASPAQGVGFSVSVAVLRPGKAPATPAAASGSPFADWRTGRGQWSVSAEGIVRQDLAATDCRFLGPATLAAADVDFTLRARKEDGQEGFLVFFRVRDEGSFYWWNVAGWGNREHGIERSVNGRREVIHRVPGHIESGRWYDLRIRAEGERLRCFLDGELVQEIRDVGTPLKVGSVGLGNWVTKASFTGLRVTDLSTGRVLLETPDVLAADAEEQVREPAFEPLPFPSWRTVGGVWTQTEDGAFRQSAVIPGCRAFADAGKLRDVVYEVTARKAAGAEGFMLIFRAANDNDLYWWNIGGWNNTRHAIERKGRDAAILDSVPGSIESGRDYLLRVAAVGPRLRCWLDGKLVHDISEPAYGLGSIGLATWNTAVEYRDAKVAEIAAPGDRSRAFYRPDADFGVALTASVKALRAGQYHGPPSALLSALRRDHPEALPGFLRAAGGAEAFAGWLARADASLSAAATRLATGLGTDPAAQAAAGLHREQADAGDARWPGVVLATAAAARRRALAQCPPIAFVARRGYGLNGTNGTMFAHRTGVGSEVFVWDPREPGTGPHCIFATESGFVWDLCPDWDGRRLLMSYKAEVWEPFHIWEIGVDGSGLRQVTEGPAHDFNPVYLPGDRIAFSSSRVASYSMCQDFLACALYTGGCDGTDIRRIDFTTLCTNAAAVLSDGALIATRWEYQDKNIFSWQGLWTVRPDGDYLSLYFGNTLTVPNSLYGPRPIPGTVDKVVITMAAHHYPPIGDIAIVDRRLGVENPAGCRKITAATPYQVSQGRDYRDCNWGPGDVFYPYAYADPWPVSTQFILVSYGGGVEGEQHFRLCALMGDGGSVELLDIPGRDLFSAVSLAPRPRPHRLPLRSADDTGMGTFYAKDIGCGLREQGVQDGLVARLRVVEVLPKPYNTEGPRYRDHYPVIGYGSYYAKRILGEIPVRADGSLHFRAPAGVELYFIALDAQGREVQRMGSVTQLSAGAQVGCVGCHENRLSAPPTTSRPTLLNAPPDEIEPPAWGDGGPVAVDFVRSVQPVLDRHCVSCHSGPNPDGGIDLSDDKTRMFSMAYCNLTLRDTVDYTYINRGPTGVFPALQTGSRVSRLTTLLETGHGKAVVPDAERRILYAWIDADAPYYGTWEMSRPHCQGGRDTWTSQPGTTPLPWFAQVLGVLRKCGIAAPGIEQYGSSAAGHLDETKINLTHPEWSALLLENLAVSAGGRAADAKAVFTTAADPDYATLLDAIREGARLLAETPRLDMPGARPIAQKRDFGVVFGAPRPVATTAP